MTGAHLASDHVPILAELPQGCQESLVLFLGPAAYTPSLPAEAEA